MAASNTSHVVSEVIQTWVMLVLDNLPPLSLRFDLVCGLKIHFLYIVVHGATSSLASKIFILSDATHHSMQHLMLNKSHSIYVDNTKVLRYTIVDTTICITVDT